MESTLVNSTVPANATQIVNYALNGKLLESPESGRSLVVPPRPHLHRRLPRRHHRDGHVRHAPSLQLLEVVGHSGRQRRREGSGRRGPQEGIIELLNDQ